MRKKKEKGRESALRPLDSPSNIFKSQSRIEINGSSDLLVEGCVGVLEYSDVRIRVSLGRQSLVITGSDLGILNMFGDTLSIGGRIAAVEFV